MVNGTVTDVSRTEPSIPWAGGALVATGADLNRFYAALAAGRVVPADELREMRDTVPTGSDAKMDYGLGLGSMRLSCGAEFFGHGGGIYGYLTLTGATTEGRAVTYQFTKDMEVEPEAIAILSDALCP